MPGVPSGKGCNACRRAKKKCDQQKPQCSRCKRLNVACDGAGTQRYLFKDHSVVKKDAQRKSPSTSPDIEDAIARLEVVLHVPASKTSRLIRSFVSVLEIQDVRFNLMFAQGPLLADLPRRIETSKALETTTYAFLKAYEAQRNPCRKADVISLYIEAIRDIRDALADPLMGQTAETLCAVYLLMVIQAWVGSSRDTVVGHGTAIVYLLETGRFKLWDTGPFEQQLLATMCACIALESYVRPALHLSPWIRGCIFPNFYTYSTHGPPEDWTPLLTGWTDETMAVLGRYLLYIMLRIPDLLRDIELRAELPTAYLRLMAIVQKLGSRMPKVRLNMQGAKAEELSLPAAGYLRITGLALGLAAFVNGMLQPVVLERGCTLEREMGYLTTQILELAELAGTYRPLGAMHVSVSLSVALAVNRDDGIKGKIEEAILGICGMALAVVSYARTMGRVLERYREWGENAETGMPWEWEEGWSDGEVIKKGR